MTEYRIEILLLVFLAVMSYEDWKEKQVDAYIAIAFAGIGLVLQLCVYKSSLWELVAGVCIGSIILAIAWITDGSIGTGDGVMLLVSGIFLGFWKNLSLFFTAQLLLGIAALFLIAVKKKGRSYRVPFAPFLLAAYLLQLL